jgi:hypothetical protein
MYTAAILVIVLPQLLVDQEVGISISMNAAGGSPHVHRVSLQRR